MSAWSSNATVIAGNAVVGNRLIGVAVDGNSTGTVIGSNGDGANDLVEGNVITGNLTGGVDLNNVQVAGSRVDFGVATWQGRGRAQRISMSALQVIAR